HMVFGEPPEAGILFSFPSAKKPMFCESGEKNGNKAPSVFSKRSADSDASVRTHNVLWPVLSTATKASLLPSGETADATCILLPSGGSTAKLTASVVLKTTCFRFRR